MGQEKNDDSRVEFLDPLETDDLEGEKWQEEAKKQKIRKRKGPVWEEGSLPKKGRGGPFRKGR